MRKDIDRFGSETHIPPMCLVSVYPLNAPDTVERLRYGIPLEGIYLDDHMETETPQIYIHKELKGIIIICNTNYVLCTLAIGTSAPTASSTGTRQEIQSIIHVMI